MFQIRVKWFVKFHVTIGKFLAYSQHKDPIEKNIIPSIILLHQLIDIEVCPHAIGVHPLCVSIDISRVKER